MKRVNKGTWALIACLVVLIGFGFLVFLYTQNQTRLMVEAINVGHGDCLLFTLPSGEVMVVDTGDGSYKAQSAMQKTLTDHHISKIDVLVLTHPHKDHIGGVPWLFDHYPVETVYMTARPIDSSQYTAAQAAITSSGASVHIAQKGDAFTLGQLFISFLAPYDVNDEEVNNSSLVMQMTYGKTKLLLMGDAQKNVEKLLAKEYGDRLKCDLLKVGHHAIKSCTPDFLSLAQPAVAVVSMADPSVYDKSDHQEDCLQTLSQYAGSVFRTDLDDTIRLYISPNHHISVY